MDRGAWWVIVHGVTKSWTRLKRLSMHVKKIYTVIRYSFKMDNHYTENNVHLCDVEVMPGYLLT